MRSHSVLLLALLFLISASPALSEPSEATASELDTGRVLLVPLNLGVRAAPEVESGMDPVWQELVSYFEAREPKLASLARDSASDLWEDAVSDPAAKDEAGERDVYAAYASFARRVAEQVEYDSIVIPSLVTRTAKVRGQRASWDGVRRYVETPRASLAGLETRGGGTSFAVNGIRGRIGAASLHVAVLSADGELRYEGAGGLAVLQRPVLRQSNRGNGLEMAVRSEAFQDRKELREGIETAFQKPLPASRAR